MQPGLAIALKLAAVTLAVVMASLVKAMSDIVPPGEAVFFRSLFAVPVILAWLAMRRDHPRALRMAKPPLHLLRGCLGVTSMSLFFTGLGILPLAEVKSIQYATPLLVVLFAALLLGERLRAFRLVAVALGLTGVFVIMWPRLTALAGPGLAPVEGLAAALVLGSSVCAALSQVTVRRMVDTENIAAIVFWFSIIASVLSLFTLPFGWVVPGPTTAAMLVLTGILGGAGQIFLTAAYRFADAGVIAPFDYASVLLALGIGYVVFGELPTSAMLAGAALVIVAGVLIIWRERQLGMKTGEVRRRVTPQG